MKYITKLSTIAAATGVGALLVTGVTGCTGNTQQQEEQSQAKGAFVIIEEITPGKYKIKDEFPAEVTRIVLVKLDGTEQVLTQAQLDALLQEEKAKIDNGTSELTEKQTPQMQQQGMGLGDTIMASMAGAMLGAWMGNKLFGNQNYKNNRKAAYKSPSTYSKSKKSFSQPRKSTSSKKGGFFGNKKSSRSSSRRGGFFGG